jgi:tetratricopeptide (TPR) repeat protein
MKTRDRKATVKKERTVWPLQVAALTAITVIAYANSLHGQFIFDDQQIVMQNPALMNVRTFGDVISLGAGWRQLLFFTYGLNYYWGGLNTFSYHAVNLFLHIENVLLVYAIILVALREKASGQFAALAGAAVFSVHTIFSGAVSYIAGRSSVLCATFYFASVLFFLKALDATRTSMRIAYFALTGVAWLLAFQAKQEAIALPLLLAAIAFLRSEKKDWRVIVPLAAIPLIAVIVTRDQLAALYESVSKNQVLVAAGFEEVLSPGPYFRTYITSVVGYYFPRFVFPAGLSADPHIVPVDHWYSPEFLFSLITLAGLVWLTWRFARREPLLSLGITALLVSPLMAYAAIPLADVVLEHRAYIPGLGVAFLFAWVFQWIARNYAHLRWAALGAVVLLFGVMTISRNPVFASNIALWEDAERKAPAKPRPHFNLGQAYQQAQRLDPAIREYEHALALKPDIHAAYSNLAAIYLDQKQFDKGEEVLLRVTSLAPEFTEGFINLGVLYIRRQDPDRALKALNRAIELNRDSFPAHFNRGEALTQKGDFKAALESYKEAVHLRPDIVAFRLSLGVAYSRVGDRESAQKELLALTNGANAAEAYRQLGVLYNDAGQPDQALKYFRQAAMIRNVYPELHHDLGVAYIRKQMWSEAIEEFRLTLEQLPDYGPAFLNLALVYQMKGENPQAKQTLQTYVDRYGSSNSPYVAQARARLAAMK